MALKLAVSIPCYGGKVAVGHAKMWMSLGAAIEKSRDIDFRIFIEMDVCGVDRARNFLLAYAMQSNANWLLMVDSDTWTDQGSALLQMIRDGEFHGASIIGAPVLRQVDGLSMSNLYSKDPGGKYHSRSLSVDTTQILEVDAIGAAIMAINLRKVPEDLSFKFTDDLSEDLYFCDGMKKAGGKILCDPRIRTNHVKNQVLKWIP